MRPVPLPPDRARHARPVPPWWCAAVGLVALALPGVAPAEGRPKVHDPRLELTLFAADPDVMTPVGLAIDVRDRLFVLESHTHSPPRNYPGPKSDRVKVFTDEDGDGKPERQSVFADGIEDGMNLAFSPEGELYVVTSTAVWRLDDRDGDGVSDGRQKVLELLTPERPYEHAALLGITFSPDGWLYASRGNVGSLRYTIRGADGSSVGGYGDGGNVVRCRPDGSGVEQVATGFWNPFGLGFDRFGRLLCVDNDPDARGPNRLVHVIPGGDYGYKSMYGGGGNHPYQAWNGELPGTLPFVAGLGEAPCGLLDASRAALPIDYQNSVLCTVWGEHQITRARLRSKGTSVTAETEILVEGDQDFRPVALAADGRGAVYFTDWVQRDYPNHGRGRIWRLTAKPGVETAEPRSPYDMPLAEPGMAKLAAVAGAASDAEFDGLLAALKADDPFLRSAAIGALAGPVFRSRVIGATEHTDPAVRLGALLALRQARHPDPDASERVARRLLADPDARVRRMALVWAGERVMTGLRGEIGRAVAAGDVPTGLFETYLATAEVLTPEFAQAFLARSQTKANQLPRRLDPSVVESIVRDAGAAPALRALALTRLARPAEQENLAVLKDLLSAPHAGLRVEAVRTLATSNHAEAAKVLLRLANDRSASADVRAEAVLALAGQPGGRAKLLLPLLDDPEPAIRLEAVRSLQGAVTEEPVRQALAAKLKALEDSSKDARLTEQLRFALFPPGSEGTQAARPQSPEQWQAALAEGGDPAAGRRAFFSAQVGCAKCHTIDNRGGKLGPDLSHVGQSRDRAKLVHAIVRPSDEYSIDYQAWYVKTTDGQTHLGLQLDLKDRGDIELFTTEGKTVHFDGPRIAAYGALEQSLMPDGLDAAMSVGDFRDLVAFLEAL